jgi:superfamily II DNA/RNA helicase
MCVASVDTSFLEAAQNNGNLPKKLVFVEQKRTADLVATMLSDEKIKAQTVNGDRSQQLREEATEGFRRGEYSVLVVTNVFARGMDFTDLGHVINFELPNDRDTYVHRIGRTGRLNAGVAVSFFDPEHPNDRSIAPQLIRVC